MATIDVEALLAPVSEDSPCGENLEYDASFIEMVQAGEEKAAQQMGDSVIEAQPADWKTVRKLSEELTRRTKDLRVGMLLTRALLHTAGPVGLADGLAFLLGLIERHWDHLHPELDPDDDNDPTMRVNVLIALVDDAALLRPIHMAPIVESKAMGRFSLRDIEIARGDLIPGGAEEPADTAVVDAAFMDAPLEELQATAQALKASIETAKKLETVLTEKVGTSFATDLSALPERLGKVQTAMSEQLQRRGVDSPGAEVSEVAVQPTGESVSGAVNSREDVIRVLDKACHYYERYEPSSPVPLLLRRAKRLVAKDFMEILRDLAPEGVSQAEKISGSGES